MADLSQLKLLIALDEKRNLSRAAQQLHLSQSAVSHALGKLRIQLDNPLFVRTSNGMVPTHFTELMLPTLKQGMKLIDQSLEVEKSFNPNVDAKTFYIGVVDYFEFIALPKLVTKFSSEAPNIRLSIDINAEVLKMERVEGGQLDIYVGVYYEGKIPNHFTVYPWRSSQFVGVVAEWRELPEQLTMNQFLSESHIHLPITNNSYDVIDDWLSSQNLYRNIQAIVQSYSVGGRVSSSSGFLFCVPEEVARELTLMLPLRIVKLPDGIPPLNLYIITHKLYEHQSSTQWLLKQIMEC